MFDLLDLIIVSTSSLKKHILGCVLDLLENPKTRLYLLEWKWVDSHKHMINLPRLLIQLWKEEERRFSSESIPYKSTPWEIWFVS